MVKSKPLRHLHSHRKVQAKPKITLRRFGRRQLLREKVCARLNKHNAVQAKLQEYEDEDEEEADEKRADRESSSTKLNSKQSMASSSTSEYLANDFTIEVTVQGSDMERYREGSMINPATAEASSSKTIHPRDQNVETEASHNLTTQEDEDLYYIEAIKKSRIGKNARDSATWTQKAESFKNKHVNIPHLQGKVEFFIKWEGYERKADLTWEPETTLVNCAPRILADYFSAIGGRDAIGKPRKRGRRSKKTIAASKIRRISKAQKQKLDSEQVMANAKISQKGVEQPGAVSSIAKTGPEKLEDNEITFSVPLLDQTQACTRKRKTRESFQEDLDVPEDSSDVFSDQVGTLTRKLEVTEPMPASKEQSKVINTKKWKGKSDRRELKSVNGLLWRLRSTSNTESAEKGSSRPQENFRCGNKP